MKKSGICPWAMAIVSLVCASYCKAQGPTIEVQAIIKGSANLPCNIRPPVKNDSTILVVWYRNEMDVIYSFDRRGKPSEEGTHWKNNSVIGNRAFFRTSPDPATLILEDVKLSDSSSYRCRVDFQRSPTKNNKIRLQVIEPPEKPLIYDQRAKVISNGTAGPYQENSDVKFICRVYGGLPIPKVKWWRNEVLLDSTYSVNTDEKFVESQLIVTKVSRADLKASFTCQASNNNISVPQATSITMDLHLSPLSVSILSSHQPLTADRKYEVVCQAVGSRPPAKITWWKDNERLTNYTDEISSDANVTTSTLMFVPEVRDHNKTLICRAMNPRIKTAIDEDAWILDITFLPVPVLSYGPELLNQNDVEEGDAVFFLCNVYANPRAYKIIWKHNGFIVQDDPKAGVLVSGTALKLNSVNRHQSGNYTCFASNVEGDNESNALELRVMYKPICKSNQKLIYGYALNENAHIPCEVDAYPIADAFSWSLNNSREASEGEKHRKSERKRNISILHITPVLDVDYGYLWCSAKNAVGEQSEPCIFHLIPAGRPHPPQNCTIVNQTINSLGVECVPGFDGGQSPLFVLDVINEDSGILVANSSASTPSFYIDNLSPGTTLTMNLYAQNGRGRSQALVVEGSTLNAAEKRTGLPTMMNLTPYAVLLVGLTIFCFISGLLIIKAIRAHAVFGTRFFNSNRNSSAMKQDLSMLEQTIKLNVTEEDDKNPDVVPSTKEDEYEAMHLDADIKRCSSVERFYEGRSLSSPTSTATDDEEDVWRLTNSGSRNGDLHKFPRAKEKPSNGDIDCSNLLLRESAINQTTNRQPQRTKHMQSDRTKPRNVDRRLQEKLETAPSCNVIRVSSQKEIVTVRSALVSSQQESCV